ncbi:MAG: hypothetical protein ACP5U1_11635 [Desulfomonilaceae bacterium]
MGKFSKLRFVTSVLAPVLVISLVFLPSFANSFEDIEQQRDLCIQDCHEQFDDDEPGIWQLAADCINRCERNYWKKWNRQMNNIGEE